MLTNLNELVANPKFIYLIIGSILTLITGTIAFAIQSFIKGLFKRKGHLHIFYKHVHGKASNNKANVIRKSGREYQISIPLWIEFLNTTQINKVIRDLNLVAFYKGKKVSDFIQINEYTDNRIPLANDGAYSFLIEGHNIKKYELYFILLTEKEIDEIRICYYNLKNKQKYFKFLSFEDKLIPGEIRVESEWHKVK